MRQIPGKEREKCRKHTESKKWGVSQRLKSRSLPPLALKGQGYQVVLERDQDNVYEYWWISSIWKRAEYKDQIRKTIPNMAEPSGAFLFQEGQMPFYELIFSNFLFRGSWNQSHVLILECLDMDLIFSSNYDRREGESQFDYFLGFNDSSSFEVCKTTLVQETNAVELLPCKTPWSLRVITI